MAGGSGGGGVVWVSDFGEFSVYDHRGGEAYFLEP